jgi:hypothetical protein
MKNYLFKFGLLLLFTVLFNTGCSNQISVSQSAVDSFKPAYQPKDDELVVYIIRKSSLGGIATKTRILANQRTFSFMGSGDYSYIVLPRNQLNVVNLTEHGSPVSFVGLKPSNKAFRFIYYPGPTTQAREVSFEEGATITAKSNYLKLEEIPEKNAEYTTIVMNPGLIGYKLMKETTEHLKPDADHAVVTFYAPEDTNLHYYSRASDEFSIWHNKEGLLGTLIGETAFEVKLKAGEHTFIAGNEHASVIKANLSAGKKYYLHFEPVMFGHFLGGRIFYNLEPVTDQKGLQKAQKKSNTLTLRKLNPEAITPALKEHIKNYPDYLNRFIEKAEKTNNEKFKIKLLPMSAGL